MRRRRRAAAAPPQHAQQLDSLLAHCSRGADRSLCGWHGNMQAAVCGSGLAAKASVAAARASEPVARPRGPVPVIASSSAVRSSACHRAGLAVAAAAGPHRRAVAAAAGGPASGGAERDYKVALITGANTGRCCMLWIRCNAHGEDALQRRLQGRSPLVAAALCPPPPTINVRRHWL